MTACVLLIGASGALGAHIDEILSRRDDIDVIRGTRSSASTGSRVVDVTDERSVAAALESVDLVVVAVPQRRPLVQRVCSTHAVPCVDVSPEGELVRLARREVTSTEVPLVMMCGFFPGLSGILARHTADQLDEVKTISVGLIQSTNAHVGPTGVKDMLATISRPVPTRDGGKRGFKESRTLDFGTLNASVRLVDYAERDELARALDGRRDGGGDGDGVDVRYYTAWSSALFTKAIAAAKALGVLGLLTSSRVSVSPRHNPSRPQTAYLAAEARGTLGGRSGTRRVAVEARSDYGATASVVVEVAKRVLRDECPVGGVVTTFDVVTLDALRDTFDDTLIVYE